MRRAGSLSVVCVALLAACGAPVRSPLAKPAPAATTASDRAWKPVFPASRVLPDASLAELAAAAAPKELGAAGGAGRADGEHRILNRMRVSVGEGGVIRRADDLLPVGAVAASELPARLGGGYVVAVINAHGTQIYRAESWLAKLKPLVELASVADRDGPIVVGFDRLYVRLKTGNEILAIDPASGQPLPLGPLPLAPSYGDMVFVDGWRAVVETELRGVMATFDAGATWRPIPIDDRIRSVGEREGDPLIVTDAGEYHLDARGALGFSPAVSEAKTLDALEAKLKAQPKARLSPLGKKPLRAALEDGYPEEGRTGVVARGGVLARVSLDDGAVLGTKEHAFPETATCHGIKLGPRFGFVCGEANGKTLLYEYAPPLDMKLTASFDDPRVVTESGQGLVVVSGTCAAKNEPQPLAGLTFGEPDSAEKSAKGDATSGEHGTEKSGPGKVSSAKGATDKPASDKKEPAAPPRSFCVRGLHGSLREIRVRGNVGSERVVALADGRVVVLVPPRPGSMGQLSIIDGARATHVAIKIPDDAPARELQVGMWLDGFQEVGPNEIAGWVEAGGPVVGVRLKLDGSLSSGQLVEEDNGVLVAGPFGLALGARGRALETIDGGLSWKDIVLPIAPTETGRAEDRVRRCGPIGCALPGVLRVGWGEPSVPSDLTEPADPPGLHVALSRLAFAPLKLDCLPTEARPERGAQGGPRGKQKTPSTSQAPGSWSIFRGVDPPELGPDEEGIDHGQSYDEAAPMRAYAWGKKDSDWSRTGRFLIRFSDRWSPLPVRSSAVSQSLWADESAASMAIGVGSYGYSVDWHAYPDPRGEAAIASACRSGACKLFAVDDGRPVLPLRAGQGIKALTAPLHGAVRIGEAWFYLADKGNDRFGIYRADLGTVRLLRELPRPHMPRYSPGVAPRLVRRANGSGVGVTFVAKRDATEKKGDRYVLPIDPETGDAGDPIDVGKDDLATLGLSVCGGSHDGWLLDLDAADPTALVSVDGTLYNVDGPVVRVRLDPGFACIEAAAGSTDHPPPAAKGAKKQAGPTFPLVTTEQGSHVKASLACTLGG